MNKLRRLFLPLGLVLLVLGLAWAGLNRQGPAPVQASLISGPPQPVSGAFERATGPRELVFPRDHGPHPDFQTEWWYYTGNLQTAEGRRFGYQLTFFRRAILPADDRAPRPSEWAAEQVYLAHFTLTDAGARRFSAFERFERGSAGLAGAEGQPSYQVWLRDWSVRQVGQDQYALYARQDDITLELTLTDGKGLVYQGEQGYSQKGAEPGNASLYYSQTRLESTGTVTVDGQAYPVSGLSWLDREISTSLLSPGEVGWDWFSLQLDDGSELMAFVIRRKDGTISEFSSGTWIAPDGQTTRLSREQFEITVLDTWKSPHSGGVYPARWQLRVPDLGLDLRLEPLLPDQELNVSFTYWEGAVEASGTRAGQPLRGAGYVELTGYAQTLEGQL